MLFFWPPTAKLAVPPTLLLQIKKYDRQKQFRVENWQLGATARTEIHFVEFEERPASGRVNTGVMAGNAKPADSYVLFLSLRRIYFF